MSRFRCLPLILSACCIIGSGQAEEQQPRFLDPDDGCLDLSNFIDEPRGFVPLVSPITEPAVGYGAVVAPIFIQPNEVAPDGRRVRPNLATVGGFGTDGGSKGWFGGWSAAWLDGRLETKIAAVGANLNLDFYGAGLAVGAGLQSIGYELDLTGGLVEARYRLKDSPWMLGLRYLYATADSTFLFQLPNGVRSSELNSTLGAPSLIVAYDTRDTIFTPRSGSLFEATATFNDPFFGADATHQRIDLIGIHFRPLGERVTLGIKGEINATAGDTPFYALPYVSLRGVPVQRYQGKTATSVEAEIRWQLWNRFSLIGFAGIGSVGETLLQLDEAVVSGGAGFRYELARKHQLHMGIDFGFSEEDNAIYVVFGSAWMRP